VNDPHDHDEDRPTAGGGADEATTDDHHDGDGTVREPPNSTVDDWLGQRVERDRRRAERLADEEADPEEAERRYEAGAERHRPEDLPTDERPG